MTFLNNRAPSGHRICRNLRCKEMYYTSELAPPEKVMVTSDEDDRHVYWCVKTALKFGVDKRLATLDSCSPERECYDG